MSKINSAKLPAKQALKARDAKAARANAQTAAKELRAAQLPMIEEGAMRGASSRAMLEDAFKALQEGKAVTCKEDLAEIRESFSIGCLRAIGLSHDAAIKVLASPKARSQAANKAALANMRKAWSRAIKPYGWASFEGRGGARAPRMAGTTAKKGSAAPSAAPSTAPAPVVASEKSFRPSKPANVPDVRDFLLAMRKIFQDYTASAGAILSTMPEERKLLLNFSSGVKKCSEYWKGSEKPEPKKAA